MTSIKKKPNNHSLLRGPEGFLQRAHVVQKQLQERAVVELSSFHLLHNYQAIQEIVPGQAILPMLKANAYGHGMEWAARTLSSQPGLYGMGVATLEEGAQLRTALPSRG